MIAALCDYYAASGDEAALSDARRAAEWIAAHRAIDGGGFRHDEVDAAGPYLGDTLAMGQAYFALYNVTGDRAQLRKAESAAQFISAHFAPAAAGAGFITSARATDAAYAPHADRDENSALVRFLSALSLASGDESYQKSADEAMRYLASRSVAMKPLSAPILLANEDATQAPIHVTVLGAESDPAFVALHAAALRAITSHEVIEMRDPADTSRSAIAYPTLDRAALFLCTARACSSPTFKPEDVRAKIERAEKMLR